MSCVPFVIVADYSLVEMGEDLAREIKKGEKGHSPGSADHR